ncbi:MAG: DUF4440 domain-containing protein [Gammaproteobacteria bacterium]|nr:DUF4440 domain-containing protein [Gammaproteobacteria bacterium]
MRALKPEQCDPLLIEALHAGNVDDAVSLYEPNASFVTDSGDVVVGHAAIRKIMEGYLAAKARFVLEEVKSVPCGIGDLAVTRARWRASGTGPDGKPATFGGRSIEVVRRQPDGRWLFVMDVPQEENWARLRP